MTDDQSPPSDAAKRLAFAALDAYGHPDHFGMLLGYEITAFDLEAREARVALTMAEKHLSPSGKVHGGVLSALLDYSCGVAVCTTLEPTDRVSTVELKVNYFRPVNRGERAEVTARVVFRGKKLCALTAFLHVDGTTDPAAMASATFNVVESKR
jgi:uncharacterized protein (TIGR00369 family)